MSLNQWLVYAKFDSSDKQWRATVGNREVSGSMQDIVLALNAAHYRIISVVATTTDLPPAAPGDGAARQDAYTKGYAIFVDIETG